jgi:hypothetical protein
MWRDTSLPAPFYGAIVRFVAQELESRHLRATPEAEYLAGTLGVYERPLRTRSREPLRRSG